ncbi:MAG: glycosyltransferase family 4 protein [Nonlabens sp.]
MKKLLYITNIPAPYRQKRFNKLAEIFPKFGLDLEVLYMAKIEPNRKWHISKDSYNYKYKIFWGIHPTVGNMFAHFNPGLLLRLLKKDYHYAVVGGMSSPTHWLSALFVRSRITIMSVESNMNSVKRTTGLSYRLKKFLLGGVDAYQVTGNPQIEYINFFANGSSSYKPFIKLPNLIDDSVFVDLVEQIKLSKREQLRAEYCVENSTQMWVLPARLIRIKGILPFLKLLKGKTGYKLFILGEGELKNEIEQFILTHELNVILAGFVQQDDIVNYYAAADLFILPSLEDPSPLSPIEASAAKLPLLVSDRIGNKEDLIIEGLNGWSFDIEAQVKFNIKIIDDILKLNNPELKKMGLRSYENFNVKFDVEACLISYVENIKAIDEN